MHVLQLMMLVLERKCKYYEVFQIMNGLIGHKFFTIGVLQQKNWPNKTPLIIFQCERWMGLMFCKYTKIQHLQEAHKPQVYDDVFLLNENMITMEEVLHFHL
jgi:hypothetical protein